MYGETDECPICFAPMDADGAVRLLPCCHSLCASCAGDVPYHVASGRCPLCRGFVVGRDPPLVAKPGRRRSVSLAVGNGRHAGVTLCDHSDGLVVVGVCEGDAAAGACLRVGDVITQINGMSVTRHSPAVKMIDDATEHSFPLRICVAKEDRDCKDQAKKEEASLYSVLSFPRKMLAPFHRRSGGGKGRWGRVAFRRRALRRSQAAVFDQILVM